MISIIVPVYNVEPYLPRCLESILAQSYRDFEVLLIDDGSTDKSGEICDRYAMADQRFRVFHKINGGLSDARNYGLDRMRGEYVTFVDSDDYVGVDYLRILAEMIQQEGTNLSMIGMSDTQGLDIHFVESNDNRTLLSAEETYRQMLIGRFVGTSACAKLFRAEMFEGMRYPVGRVYEDWAIIPRLLHKCGRSVHSRSRQYYYYQRGNSISHSVSKTHISTWVDTMNDLLDFTKQEYRGLYDYAEARAVKYTFWYILDRILLDDNYIKIAKEIKTEFRNHFSKAWMLPELTTKERFKVTIFMLSVRLFRAIRLPIIKLKGNQILTNDQRGV